MLNYDYPRALVLFVSSLRRLENWNSSRVDGFDGLVEDLWVPRYHVRDLHRLGAHGFDLGDSCTRRVMNYVLGCVGHRVDLDLMSSPRLSALWAGRILGERWVRAEGLISGDHVAVYLYLRGLGFLPREMRTRLVMESYVEVTPFMKLCTNLLGGGRS
jgi:hypothetical protein